MSLVKWNYETSSSQWISSVRVIVKSSRILNYENKTKRYHRLNAPFWFAKEKIRIYREKKRANTWFETLKIRTQNGGSAFDKKLLRPKSPFSTQKQIKTHFQPRELAAVGVLAAKVAVCNLIWVIKQTQKTTQFCYYNKE